jgi:hypothetical protein
MRITGERQLGWDALPVRRQVARITNVVLAGSVSTREFSGRLVSTSERKWLL